MTGFDSLFGDLEVRPSAHDGGYGTYDGGRGADRGARPNAAGEHAMDLDGSAALNIGSGASSGCDAGCGARLDADDHDLPGSAALGGPDVPTAVAPVGG